MKNFLIVSFMVLLGGCLTKEPLVHVRYEYKQYNREAKSVLTQSEVGTGFFISRRGYIVTAAHVIAKGIGPNRSIWVYPNGLKRPRRQAKVIEVDFANDIAIIKIAPLINRKIYSFCPDVNMDEVVIVKAWRTLSKQITVGHTEKPITMDSSLYYLISAWSHKGFSGSPVVSYERSCVVGIVTHKGLLTYEGKSFIKHPNSSKLITYALENIL